MSLRFPSLPVPPLESRIMAFFKHLEIQALWRLLCYDGARWVLGAISVVMAITLLSTLWQLHEQVQDNALPSPNWYAQRLQTDTLRLRLATYRFEQDPTPHLGQEVMHRFDGLIAVVDMLRQNGSVGIQLRTVPSTVERLDLAAQKLELLEMQLKDLIAGQTRSITEIHENFSSLEQIWRHLTTEAIAHFGKAAQDRQTRDIALYHQAQFTLIMGVMCTLLLLAISFLQLRRSQQLSDELESLVAQRTNDLSRALDEVSQSHDRLQLIDAKQRLILSSIEDGLYGVDSDGRCSFCNPAAARLLGYDNADELAGQLMDILVLGGLFAESPQEKLLDDGPTSKLVMPRRQDHAHFYRKDGTTFPVEYRAYPMVRDHVQLGAVVVFRNIHDRLEQESRKVQQQKLETVGQLSGGIAHDFNNLLTVILGNLALLELEIGDIPNNTELQTLIEEARSAGQDGVELTRRLLTFARKQPIRRERLDLIPFLERFTRMVRRTLPENIEVRWRCGEGLALWGDMSLLENTLLNLSINANHAMPHGGSLLFDIQLVSITKAEHAADPRLAVGHYICLAVVDTGVGMSPEVLTHACDPFFSTKGGKGSGLGLSSAYAFAEQSGGALRLTSQLHKGTRIELYLPAAEQVGESESGVPQAETSPRLLRGQECILVVEDKETVRRVAVRALEQLGYQVLQASNAIEAMSLLSQDSQIEVVFSDIVMPGGMSGRQLADWVRVCRPEVRVLLTTGFTQEDISWQTDGLGVPILRKPYDIGELAQRMRELLDTVPVDVELTGGGPFQKPR